MLTRTGLSLTLAAVVSLSLTAPAPAAKTLAQRMKAVEAKLNCLQRYPVFAFGDYAFYDLANPSVPVLSADVAPVEVDVLRDNQEITALDFNYGPTIGHSDAFLLGVKNTIACKQKFPIAKNPVSARPVVSRAKMRWLR